MAFCGNSKKLTNFCEYFELGAVGRFVYLVDLEKCYIIEYLVAKIGFGTEENEPSKV